MSHRIIINNFSAPSGSLAEASAVNPPTFSFEFSPDHSLTDAQIGTQVAKINHLLNKAVQVANGEPVE